jgi:hypothetical protein
MPTLGNTVQSAFDPIAFHQRMDERDFRYAIAGLVTPQPGSVMSYKSGVFAGGAISGTTLGDASHGGLRVTVAATGSSPLLNVNLGNCLIDTPSNGPYLCGLDAIKTLGLATPSATQRRIDLIIARIYDDRNSAIGSTAGDRRFVVQAITGDNTSGTPVVPSAFLPANGWIPLFAAQVEANGTTITLTDMRGPGLTARGGKRVLYGADAKITSAAFLEAGAYAGDQRYVVGHPFPNQTYFVASDAGTAGWRGDGGKLIYTKNAPAGAASPTLGQGTVRTIVSQTIPAFGIPVIVRAGGRLNPISIDPNVGVEARTRISGGALISYAGVNNFGGGSALPNVIAVPALPWGPLTAQTIIDMDVLIRNAPNGGSGFVFSGNDTGQHVLVVEVEPANIDPIKIWL